MEIGDVVIPRRISGISESLILHSGSNLYPCAIIEQNCSKTFSGSRLRLAPRARGIVQ